MWKLKHNNISCTTIKRAHARGHSLLARRRPNGALRRWRRGGVGGERLGWTARGGRTGILLYWREADRDAEEWAARRNWSPATAAILNVARGRPPATAQCGRRQPRTRHRRRFKTARRAPNAAAAAGRRPVNPRTVYSWTFGRARRLFLFLWLYTYGILEYRISIPKSQPI